MFILFFIYIRTSFSTSFPMFLSAHPVMPPFILPLCQHRAFTHYVSHCLTHFTTQSTLAFSLSFVIFVFIAFFLMVCSCTAIISDSVSHFTLLSRSHSHFSFPLTSSIWLKNCPCSSFCFNTLLCSFLLLSLNSFTLSITSRCCS